MKQILILSLILVLFAGCTNSNQTVGANSLSEALPHISDILNIQTSHFSEIDSSGILMFPLDVGENKFNGEFRYKEMPQNGYWNILFHNTNTHEQHLLTENKILILDYSFKYGREEGVKIGKEIDYIFYTARIKDFNNDKIFDEKDPLYLFVSDKFGKNFSQISPDNYNLMQWEWVESNNQIIMTAAMDSNKNNQFDEKDEMTAFTTSLDTNENPKEIFDDKLKTKLKELYARDWKRIND